MWIEGPSKYAILIMWVSEAKIEPVTSLPPIETYASLPCNKDVTAELLLGFKSFLEVHRRLQAKLCVCTQSVGKLVERQMVA